MEEEIESNNTDSSEDSVEIRVKDIRPSNGTGPQRLSGLSKRKSFIPKKILRPPPPPAKRPCTSPAAVQTEPLALVVLKHRLHPPLPPPPPPPGPSRVCLGGNYKNMTPQRRVEANARERQRVHTITNAFDRLQSAIPSPESSVKLSKLSVIKIATAYIMVLSRMVGLDYSPDGSAPSVEACISVCQELIDSESRFKVRKRTEANSSYSSSSSSSSSSSP